MASSSSSGAEPRGRVRETEPSADLPRRVAPCFDQHGGLRLRSQLGEDVEFCVEGFGAEAAAAIREFAQPRCPRFLPIETLLPGARTARARNRALSRSITR